MAWMIVHSQIHNIFASLGVQQGDAYTVSEDCLAILSDILSKLSMEDRSLRTFRRAIGFGQHIRKDLLPLLIHVKDDAKTTNATKIIDTTIKILVNLTIPVECLLSMEAVSKTDVGRHTIFEINKLLYSSKEAFVDVRSIKAVTDHMKFIIERGAKLEMEQSDSINNCLLLLRNILHIPEYRMKISNCPLAHSSMQNRILWNLFTQNIDKLLLHLMTFPQKIYWVVTIVQLIALMYKDQHIGTLQKLLKIWFETSLSESSDDNESNTSPPPPNQQSDDSSPMLTSDPTSDSSDNGGNDGINKGENGGKNLNNTQNKDNNNVGNVKQHVVRSQQNRNKVLLTSQKQKNNDDSSSTSSQSHANETKKDDQQPSSHGAAFVSSHYLNTFRAQKRKHRNDNLTNSSTTTSSCQSESCSKTKDNNYYTIQSELSDYGYGTQVENQESISTSSNEDDPPQQKPVHQKPHMVQKPRNKKTTNLPQEKKELRKKKLYKKSKINIINIKGLLHHAPTDEDISSILKEFTVDFLLRGYGSLVHELYNQRLSDQRFEIDTSHIFWLITYFLKFATQIELDFEHIEPVLSFDVMAYLVYEGVNLCEQLEINCHGNRNDLKPNLRRMHLVVTAIKEFLQAIESYTKITHLSKEEKENLTKLQIQISSTDNLKCLLLLLIRHYNPEIQSKQYLQDLIVTNHILLLFLDNTAKLKPSEKNNNTIEQHLKHFANVELMQKYGMLLEDFENNGKFINDCIFTMMHHIGGDIDNISTLFQPNILKTFSKLWESDYDICDDWSDLIEYVIHKFINVPRQSNGSTNPINQKEKSNIISTTMLAPNVKKYELWPQQDVDTLYWCYIQNRKEDNVIEKIEKHFIESGVVNKTRTIIIKKLLQQCMINQKRYEEYMVIEKNNSKDIKEEEEETIFKNLHELKEQLVKQDMGNYILWLQEILLQTCHCKIIINNNQNTQENLYEPVPYCFIKSKQSVPIVPWRTEDNQILNHETFLLLLRTIGFHLSIETKKSFIRIPHFWTAEYIYKIAQKLGPIDPANLKFDVNLLKNEENIDTPKQDVTIEKEIAEEVPSTSFETYSLILNPSTDWFHTVLHAKLTAVLDFTQNLHSSETISATIPDTRTKTSDETASRSDVLSTQCHEIPKNIAINNDMENLPSTIDFKQKNNLENINKVNVDTSDNNNIDEFEIERNSICETASVASDLTRMYVSDEEDKLYDLPEIKNVVEII